MCILLRHTYLHVGALPLLPLRSLLGITQPLGGCLFKSVEVALVAGQLAAVQVEDVGAHHVQEVAGVRNHHQGLGPLAQVILRQSPHGLPPMLVHSCIHM